MLEALPLGGLAAGLNLRDASELVSPDQAIDVLNVDFAARGAIRDRAGFIRFGEYDLPARADSMSAFEKDNGATRQLVISCGDQLRVLDSAGAHIGGGDFGSAGGPNSFARMGTIGGDLLLAADGLEAMARWNGTSWSRTGYTGLTPDGKHVAVTGSGRVIMGNFVGSTDKWATPSSLRWSDPGNPLGWQTWNYNVVTPGDGEEVMGIATWRELTFVFKRSKFFVFGKERVGAGGKPAFDPQPVDTGRGLTVRGGLAVGDEGVYFINADGVFLTSGGPAVEISEPIAPLFTGAVPEFYTGQPVDQSNIGTARLRYHRGRLSVSVPTTGTTPDRVLVFDPKLNAWTVHAIAMDALASLRVGAEPDLLFCRGTKVYRQARGYYTDDGEPIPGRWVGGWDNLGAEVLKVVREVEAWGVGQDVLIGLMTDYAGWVGAFERFQFAESVTDTWGDGAGLDTWGDGRGPDKWGGRHQAFERRMRKSLEGVVFAVVVESSSAPWTIYRVTRHVRRPRPVESYGGT